MHNFIQQFAKDGIVSVKRTSSVDESSMVRESGQYYTESKLNADQQTSPNRNDNGKYLLQFLRYIMTISNSLRASAAVGNPESKTYDVTSILSRSPRDILADLIFRLKGLNEAEHLAKLMRLYVVVRMEMLQTYRKDSK